MSDNEKENPLQDKIILEAFLNGMGLVRFDENGLYFLEYNDALFKQTEEKA